MKKLSKAEVHYSRGMKQSHCGICEHYDGEHGCEVVAGRIEPAMWCEKFTRLPKPKRGK